LHSGMAVSLPGGDVVEEENLIARDAIKNIPDDLKLEHVQRGKPDEMELERMTREKLENARKQAMEERVRMSQHVAQQKDARQKSLEVRDETKEKLKRKSEDLEHVKEQSKFSLGDAAEGRINRDAETIVNNFVSLVPRAKMDKDMTVDVKYKPPPTSDETASYEGVGAGSLVVSFKVGLDEKVEELATQAAKYWGLDPQKVFFLDRDYRVVPGSMSIGDIILPPVPFDAARPGRGSGADGVGGAASSTANSSSARVPHGNGPTLSTLATMPDEEEMLPVIRGRNYTLLLVRGGTVLDEDDLRKPKGEDWDDFTFDEKKLDEELARTRRQYGDTDASLARPNMEDIPDIAEIQRKGEEQKKMKKWDRNCRILEFVIFLLCQGCFFAVLYPDNPIVIRSRLVIEAVEHRYLDVDAFSKVASDIEYRDYVEGPLRQALVGEAMNGSNLFVVGVVGYTYAAANITSQVEGACELAADVSAGNATAPIDPAAVEAAADAAAALAAANATNQSCVPAELSRCPNQRVIAILNSGATEGHQVPLCEYLNDEWEIAAFLKSLASPQPFAYIRGQVATHPGGTRHDIRVGTNADFEKTTAVMIQGGASDREQQIQAKSFVVFVYSPDLNSMSILQLIAEYTLSGALLTSVKQQALLLSPADESRYVLLVIVYIFSCVVFLLEVRRIFGCPRRIFYEKVKDKCSAWTAVFVIHSLLLLVSVGLTITLDARDGASLVQLDADGYLTDTTANDLFVHAVIHEWRLYIDMMVLVVQNILLWRYVLGFFPRVRSLTDAIAKTAKPLIVAFLFLGFALLVFAFFMLSLFASKFYEFHSITVTLVSILKMMLGGGLSAWREMYATAPTMWSFVVVLFYLVIVLFLNNLALAIMLSHKKEQALVSHAYDHKFWNDAKVAMSLPRKRKPMKRDDSVRFRESEFEAWRPATVLDTDPLWVRPKGWRSKPRLVEKDKEDTQVERLDEFNPATAGWDFTDPKNPVDPAQAKPSVRQRV